MAFGICSSTFFCRAGQESRTLHFAKKIYDTPDLPRWNFAIGRDGHLIEKYSTTLAAFTFSYYENLNVCAAWNISNLVKTDIFILVPPNVPKEKLHDK